MLSWGGEELVARDEVGRRCAVFAVSGQITKGNVVVQLLRYKWCRGLTVSGRAAVLERLHFFAALFRALS